MRRCLWAQTQRGAISEDLPGHLTPAVHERAHLGPPWPVCLPVDWVCPAPTCMPVLRDRAALFPRVFVVHLLHLVASGEETRGGEGTGPRDTPRAPSALRAISQAPQARSGPRIYFYSGSQ